MRYADDFVILCAPGQGEALRQRLTRWLAARGLKLNEEKTRLVDSREGFNFLGFRLRWQPSRVSGKGYVHVEASGRSQQRLRQAVRAKLNHWTSGQRIPEVMTGLNRLLRGWSGYFHYRHSSRVMGRATTGMCETGSNDGCGASTARRGRCGAPTRTSDYKGITVFGRCPNAPPGNIPERAAPNALR